ncbi:MAG: hypothetical protein GC152_14360 [Alphaproteobacteria bacterium]|nr:hypothetical protein [Alphaproteobacteria bacterium]
MFDLSSLPQPVVKYGVGLWRRRWIVAAVTWLVALGGWFLVWLVPDRYESRAQVYVQTETILGPVLNGVTARPNYERRVEVMRNQLLTRPNVEKIIYNTGLKDLVEDENPVARQAAMQGLVDWVAGSIRIDSPQEMYFIIRYRFGQPDIARDVVDEVVNMLIEQDLGASLSESEDARRRLSQEIESYDNRLTAKEQEIAEFRRVNAEELAIIEGRERRLDTIDNAIARAGDELALARRSLRTLNTMLSSTPTTTSGSELDKLMVELAALRSQYEDTHPDIQNLQARIDELQGGAQGLPDNPEYRRLRNEVRAAGDLVATLEEREQQLIAERETLAFQTSQAPAIQADLKRIERDYEQTRKSYEELLARSERLNLTESLGAGRKGVEYHVYERPQMAIKPVSPPRFIMIIGALAAAFGAGGAVALGVTFLERSFTQTGELKKAFGLPVLGGLSEIGSADVRARRFWDVLRLGGALAALLAIAGAYVYWEVYRLPSTAAAGPQSASVSGGPDRSVAGGSKGVLEWD